MDASPLGKSGPKTQQSCLVFGPAIYDIKKPSLSVEDVRKVLERVQHLASGIDLVSSIYA